MEELSKYVKNLPKNLFSIDLRALGFYRILFGIAILIDLVIRAFDLKAFYTDEGVFPVDLFNEYWNLPVFWSVHAWSGSLQWEVFLFALAGVFAVLLTVGYKTKLMTVLSWLMLISIQNRNPIILQGLDQLLSLILFFALFVPWEKRYSIDAKKHPEWQNQSSVFSFGSAALLIQVAMIYLFSYLLKTGDAWRVDGTALFYALNIDEMVKPLGKYLLQFPDLLHYLTFMVLGMELAIPILFFLPFYIKESRILAVLLVIVLQTGFGLTLMVGPFPIFNIMAVMIFLPKEVWNVLDKVLGIKRVPAAQNFEMPALNMQLKIAEYGKQLLAGAMIVYLFIWNVGTIDDLEPDMPLWMRIPAYATKTNQVWDLFGPTPYRDDGWFVIPGTLANGKTVNLWGPTTEIKSEKPQYTIDHFPTFRWQKYMQRMRSQDNFYLRPYFGRYLCLNWNTEHKGEERLRHLRVFFTEEYTMPPGVEMRRKLHRLISFSCEPKE